MQVYGCTNPNLDAHSFFTKWRKQGLYFILNPKKVPACVVKLWKRPKPFGRGLHWAFTADSSNTISRRPRPLVPVYFCIPDAATLFLNFSMRNITDPVFCLLTGFKMYSNAWPKPPHDFKNSQSGMIEGLIPARSCVNSVRAEMHTVNWG